MREIEKNYIVGGKSDFNILKVKHFKLKAVSMAWLLELRDQERMEIAAELM